MNECRQKRDLLGLKLSSGSVLDSDSGLGLDSALGIVGRTCETDRPVGHLRRR